MPLLSKPRVPPVGDEPLSEEQQEILGRQREPQLNIFRTLIRHPKLMKRWSVFGGHILLKSTLAPRERELVILRTGWLCRAEYEWAQHCRIGKLSGLTDDEIRGIAAGVLPDPLDAALLRAADELVAGHIIGDETWAALSEHLSTQQLMDLVFTVGQYITVSMALNSLGVQLEEGVPGFEETAGRTP